MTKSAEGLRAAWPLVESTWQATVERARQLPEPLLHERVDGEWSFVETQRHLLFATDAWVRRAILGEAAPYHRLGMPPDHRIGEPEPGIDVAPWGIDVFAEASLDEVLEARADRVRGVGAVIAGLTTEDLGRACAPNPAPGFPPTTTFPIGFCLEVVVGEEVAHHEYAVRDLTALEARS